MKMARPRLKNRGGALFGALMLLIFLTACENHIVYNRYQTVEAMTWGKEDAYYFTFNIDDLSVPYNVTIELRHNDFYSYRNIWLFCDEELPVGPVLRDTVEFFLSDEYGRWHGKGFSLYEAGLVMKSGYSFPYKGQYTYCFRQGMRDDRLRGIQEIGLRVEKIGR
ncbi:MAG: gliding motility lipoprotein GldH [Tannerellaceae bacterium]|jgi:gliding motility-associated lipoprotein GldH|nr:gliding motility lipoprotein GldH [Tannerellaceae bacterium]